MDGTMEVLPDEIIQKIIESIEDMKSFYNLALTGRNIARITQDPLVLLKMKQRFGECLWKTSSLCHPMLTVKTFNNYKHPKVYKIPKYQFTLQEGAICSQFDELSNCSLLQLIEHILLHDRNQNYSFIHWGYSGMTNATEIVWMIWRCLLQIKKRSFEKFHRAAYNTEKFLISWIRTNANFEFSSFPPLYINNLHHDDDDDDENGDNDDIYYSNNDNNRNDNKYTNYNNNNGNENEESKGRFFQIEDSNTIEWSKYNYNDKMTFMKKKSDESDDYILNLHCHTLFHSEFLRFLEWIDDPWKSTILYEIATLNSSSQSLQPTLNVVMEEMRLQNVEVNYDDLTIEIMKMLISTDKQNLHVIVHQLNFLSFEIGAKIPAAELYILHQIEPIKNNPNIENFQTTVNFINRIHNSTRNFLLSLNDDTLRIKCAKRLISIAYLLFEQSPVNHQFSASIIDAIKVLYRIVPFHKIISRYPKMIELTELYTSDQGYSAYRSRFRENLFPSEGFPYLRLFCADLAFISEGQYDRRAGQPNEYINLRKIYQKASIIQFLLSRMRNSVKKLQFNPKLHDFDFSKKFLKMANRYDEFTAFNRSVAIFPTIPRAKSS